MIHSCAFLAYLSPETLLPATSVIATIAGIGMILGRGSLRFLIRCCRLAASDIETRRDQPASLPIARGGDVSRLSPLKRTNLACLCLTRQTRRNAR